MKTEVTLESIRHLGGYATVILRNGDVILVDRANCTDARQRFVTAIHDRGAREWYSGHYFDDLQDATTDFKARI